MIDGIIKADGTSRMMRAELPATYAEFRALAAEGKLPMDVLVNEAGWHQVPTWLNKANLLQDVTAALCGTPEDQFDAVTPDDILRRLGRFHSGLGNEYFWRMDDGTVYHWQERNTDLFDWRGNINANTQIYSARYFTSYEIVDGKFVPKNVKTISSTIANFVTTSLPVLRGKYMFEKPFWDDGDPIPEVATYDRIYRVPTSITGKYTPKEQNDGQHWLIECSDVVEMFDIYVSTLKGKYVNADNPNAYPPAVPDGHTYTYVGRLGDFTSVVTGSYVGNGKYGNQYPNKLTFPSPPKLVIVMEAEHAFGAKYGFFIWYPGIKKLCVGGYFNRGGSYYTDVQCTFAQAENTLQWNAPYDYDTSKTHLSGLLQANVQGKVYLWFALL